MKILAVTMGKNLEVFLRLYELLQNDLVMEPPAIFAADSLFFHKIMHHYSILQKADVLKEWELTDKGSKIQPNLRRLQYYEKQIGDPFLWNALLADRRIFFGKLCKVKQDYKSRFTYQQLLGILNVFLDEIDTFIKKHKPDLILSFGTATLADYLFFLFAKQKNIPYRQLKSTKIKNYIALNDTATGISTAIRSRYYSAQPFNNITIKEAKDYLNSITVKGLCYEGAILFGKRKMINKLCKAPFAFMGALRAFWQLRNNTVIKNDCHVPPLILSALYQNIVQPLKALALTHTLPFIGLKQLEKESPFLFYPLHFEPEVSLQVYGRPYQNQIELIRNLSFNVPINMKIVVKEHPRSLGFRSRSYYRKLLEIPNVRMVDPFVPSIHIVRKSAVVAVVSGTIGLEAAVCGKPVLIFGKTPYEILPKTMVRKVNITNIGQTLIELMNTYSYDKKALINYIASIINESVSVDLYTTLLGKPQRFSINTDSLDSQQKEIKAYEKLADYIKRSFDSANYKTS